MNNQNACGMQPQPQRKKTNEWTGTGIVHTRSKGKTIRIYPTRDGGLCIRILLNVDMKEMNIKAGEDAVYLPVDVFTSSSISADTLQSVRPGMRVRVAGRLTNQFFESRNAQRMMCLVVRASVFEILDEPAAAPVCGSQNAGSHE